MDGITDQSKVKVLLVQSAFLGDIVLVTPLIEALSCLHKNAEIWMLTTSPGAEVVKRDPKLNGVITFDKRGKEGGILGLWRKASELRNLGFNVAYSAHKSPRTALLLFLAGISNRIGFSSAKLAWLYHKRVPYDEKLHAVERNLALVENCEKCSEQRPSRSGDLRIYPASIAEVREELRGYLESSQQYILLVPGSAWKTKQWHWERYRELVVKLQAAGRKVILAGSGAERELCNRVGSGLGVVNTAGITTVSELVALIGRAVAVVCNDSFALHIASALKVPTVAIFCATSPKFGFGPWRNRAIVVERSELSCKPCARHGGKKCPLSTEACMRNVQSSEVYEALSQVCGWSSENDIK